MILKYKNAIISNVTFKNYFKTIPNAYNVFT